jgi:chromosome segregation ATPase
MTRQEKPLLEKGKIMPLAEDMKNIVENIISSYEARIESIERIFYTTGQLLEGFQERLLDTREEREKVNAELRENLAKNESLRKKDFDNMMQDILSAQDQREKQVKSLLKNYLNEQREMANALGESLGNVKDALSKGQAERVREFQTVIKEILAEQDERKEEVTARLNEFQKEQQEMAKRLKRLLAKGRELRIKDLKSMLKELRGQRKERIVRQQERKEEVQGLLGDLKKERSEAAKTWRTMQKKMTEKRTARPATVNMSV